MPDSAAPPPGSRPYFAGLSLLRLLAALYLVMFHVNYPFAWAPLRALFSRGASATSLFFLLSGFLLTRLYAPARDEGLQRRFLGRRLARLLPPYLLGLAVWLGVNFWSVRGFQWPQAHDLLVFLTLTQTWLPGESHLLNAPSWSASCLLFFYLLFFSLSGWLARMNGHALTLLLALLWLPALALWPWLGQLNTVYSEADWTLYLHNSPLTRLPEFVMGMVAATLLSPRLAQTAPRPVQERLAGEQPAPAHRTARVPPTGSLLRSSLLFPASTLLVLGAALLLPPNPPDLVDNGRFAPLLLLLLAGWLRLPAGLERLAASRAARALSSATLCLYLLHYPLLVAAHTLWGAAWSGPQLALYLGGCLLLAWAADAALMRPLAARLRGAGAGGAGVVGAGAAEGRATGERPFLQHPAHRSPSAHQSAGLSLANDPAQAHPAADQPGTRNCTR